MRSPPRISALVFAFLALSVAPSFAQTKAPVLVPPEVVQAPPADYPEEALRDRASGEVVLELDLDAEGKVTGSKVASGVRPDLDEAARRASLSFRFRPATRDGAPVPSRIRYRYQFRLPEAPPPAPEKAPEARPSPAESGPPQAAEPAPAARAPAVEKAEDEAQEIEVRGDRIPRETTHRVLTREEFTKAPGTNGDPLRAIQNMPGVARSSFPAMGLVVRGMGDRSTNVYVDGAWIPLIYHFGGLSSVIPGELIERLDLLPGDQSARWGRGLGGVVDVRTRELSRDGRYHMIGQVDLVDARAMVEGPVPFARDWSFVAGARRSWLDAWLGPALRSSGADVRTAPYYYDYQLFAETRFAERVRLRVGVYGGADAMKYMQNQVVEADPSIAGSNELGFGYHRAQVNVDAELSRDTRASAMLSVGRHLEKAGFGRIRAQDHIDVLFSRGEIERRLSPALTARGGWDVQAATADLQLRVPHEVRPGEGSVTTLSSGRWTSIDRTVTFQRPAAWAEAELKPQERVTVIAGVRGDYARETRTFDASPRFAASVVAKETSPKTTLRASGGVYHQPPDPPDLVPGLGSTRLLAQRSRQAAAGVEQELFGGATLSVDGYRKQLDNLITRVPTSEGMTLENAGAGSVTGVEMMLRAQGGERFFGWLSYSLSRSVRTDGPGQRERLFEQDQTHSLTALGSYKLGGGFQLGARFRFVTGSPITPCRAGLLDAASGTYACVPGAPFSERLPDFHQLDVRIDKTWEFASWKLNAYLDVQNVYNRRNAEGYSHNFDQTQRVIQPGLPILPIVGVRGEL